jgi:hypothetical protein
MRNLTPVLATAALFLTACTGPTTLIESSCNSGRWRAGTCSVKLGVLEDHYRLEVSHPDFKYYTSNIAVSAKLSVEKGSPVKVWFKGNGSQPVEVIVAPGKPVELNGKGNVFSLPNRNTLDLYFQTTEKGQGKKAENVRAEIEYKM